MLFENYDKEKKEFLLDLWQKIVLHLTKENDPKKIISFLNKCGIIGIDEKEKTIYLGVPNEFISSQVKKFFNKHLNTAIQEVFNPHYKIKVTIHESFHSGNHDLQLNLKKILGIKENTENTKNLELPIKEKLTEFLWILFDPKFRFENYVVWSNNQLAFSAGKQVAEKPGIVYNPLFIYWSVWLGKTHILQAIWNYTIQNNPDKVIVYLPTTKLIDEIVEAIRKNKLSTLLKKLEDVDILILDDIQFLAEKEKTQEIFHNIFNEFQLKKKQIIISSDRPPKELNLLEARLRSRFALWLVVDIKKPDFETRYAILKTKLREKWEELDNTFLDLISKYVKDSVRELEWALNIILTKKNLLGKEITEADIHESLETLWYDTKDANMDDWRVERARTKNNRSGENFSKVVEFISNYYNVSIYDIKWDSRKKEVSLSRQMLMYIAKKYFNWTLEKIWDSFGWKNHATVIYAINNLEKLIKHDKKISRDLDIIIEEVGL